MLKRREDTTRRSVLEQLEIGPTRLHARDLWHEAYTSISWRPGRTIATTLATAVGVAAVVATVGVAATASIQVSDKFDALRATTVIVTDESIEPVLGERSAYVPQISEQDVDRVRGLNGVESAGVTQSLDEVDVAAQPISSQSTGIRLPLLAVGPDALETLEARVSDGRSIEALPSEHPEMVCLLGSVAAQRLGVSDLSSLPAVWVRGRPLTVVGIVDDVRRQEGAKRDVFVSPGVARRLLSAAELAASPEEVVVRVDPGAATVIAAQAPTALRPTSPEELVGLAPPDPKSLRTSVESELNSLMLVVAVIALVIGGIGIANTSLVAVLERTGEIGLRRALGARRRDIAGQLMVETVLLGGLGGVFGTSVGIVTVVGVSWTRGWAPTLDPVVVLAAPLLGVVTGLVAGLHPAFRASRIEPTAALAR